MATFKEVIDIALRRIDEDTTNPDEQNLKIVKDAINQAYIIAAMTISKVSKELPLIYSKKISLPSDFNGVINLEHSTIGDLTELDYEIKSDLIFIKTSEAKSDTLTLTYSYIPPKLVNDNEILVIKDCYIYALAAFAAYTIFLYKKKYGAAQLLLSEFNTIIPSELAMKNTLNVNTDSEG